MPSERPREGASHLPPRPLSFKKTPRCKLPPLLPEFVIIYYFLSFRSISKKRTMSCHPTKITLPIFPNTIFCFDVISIRYLFKLWGKMTLFAQDLEKKVELLCFLNISQYLTFQENNTFCPQNVSNTIIIRQFSPMSFRIYSIMVPPANVLEFPKLDILCLHSLSFLSINSQCY